LINPQREEENSKEETEEESKEVFIEPVVIERSDKYKNRDDDIIIGI